MHTMKTEIATYYRPGYLPKGYRCQPGETSGTLNLFDAEGEIVVRGVQVFEDPSKEEKLPNGYCTPGLADGALPPRAPKPKAEEADGSDQSDQSDKSEKPRRAKKAEAPAPEILSETPAEPEASI